MINNHLYEYDTTFYYLAKESYSIPKKGSTVHINFRGKLKRFDILSYRYNKKNGLQMMALTPQEDVKGDQVDELYIVYAGTDINLFKDEKADLRTDIELATTLLPNHKINEDDIDYKFYGNLERNVITHNDKSIPISQFRESSIVTNEIIKKYKPNKIYGAGHSLGGSLAQYNAVIHDFNHTRTFSAPSPFNNLPLEIQLNFDNDKYQKKIINYVHKSDVIGMSEFFKPVIGSRVLSYSDVDEFFLSTIKSPISGHGLETFIFKGENIKISMDFDSVAKIKKNILNSIEHIDSVISNYENYIENTKRKSKEIEARYIDEINLATYKYISSSDVDIYLEQLGNGSKHRYYNYELNESVIQNLHDLKNKLIKFTDKLEYSSKKMEERDFELSNIYQIFSEV